MIHCKGMFLISCHKKKLKSITQFIKPSFVIISVQGEAGVREEKQDWGYVEVREGAHMFWWLYYTTSNVDSHTKKPLLIWLQTGTGVSSSGNGNFEEIGPYDVNMNPRNTSWVSLASIYSYTHSNNIHTLFQLILFAQIFFDSSKFLTLFKNIPNFICLSFSLYHQ